MKKAFRDIKRGVNKKVLKVPSIEQKVLDATSNEPWGPHGTHLIDIAQASRNYHEYQMIMSVVWKRLSDTGKNWRHVFKGLTVLEYLVINGSERVIEDIREHANQITALASFQYIDSTGRDQGSNIRKKSQILVALVNDKEKLQEAREKANASRDKFRNTSGDEGRFGNREEDRNGYGREREWGDDEYRGRSRSNDGDYGTRSQSSDRERDRSFEDDGHRSSRGSSARVEDASPDGRGLEPKLSGQNVGGPPSYEDAVSDGHSPVDTKRNGETATSSPQVNINHQEIPAAAAPPPPAAAATPPPVTTTPPPPAVTVNNENDGFDFFDPRGAAPAPALAVALAPQASGGGEMEDLFGSLSESFSSSNALALVTSTSSITTEVHPPANTNPYLTFDTSSTSQAFDDPFGDGPFKAVPSTDGFSAQPPTSPFTTTAEPPSFSVDPMSGSGGFGDTFDFDSTVDILADILPPPGPSQTAFPSQNGQTSSFSAEPNQTTFPSSFSTPFGQPPTFSSQGQGGQPFQPQAAQSMPHPAFPPQGVQQQQSMPQSAFQLPGGHQSMPQSASQLPGVQQQQPMPQSAFQLPGGHQSAFQSPGVQQSMPQSAPLPLQGGQQSMPQSAAFQLPGGQQSIMPQSALQVQGGQQSIPQPSFPAQGGQYASQPGFPGHGGQYAPQPGFPGQGGQSVPQSSSQNGGFSSQLGGVSVSGAGANGQSVLHPGFPAQGGQSGFPSQGGQLMLQAQAQGSQSLLQPGFVAQGGQNASLGVGGFPSNGQLAQPNVSQPQPVFTNSNGHAQSNNLFGGFQPHSSSASMAPLSQVTPTPTPTPAPQYNPSNFYQPQQPPALTTSTGALALVPQQPTDKKFETKSTVWADTLNRGLVNLNISGAKTNPLSDIGIDFEAINRKEKRMEKPSQTPVVSNVSMGKAMGSGSGMGRAGAGSVLRPTPNPMMGAPTGFNQPMGMNPMPPQNMGMNMGQGFQMQQGYPPGSAMPANYNNNPMMGRGAAGYAPQPYGGYR
ncbi:clathrin interactor EPSIN 2 isoform X2 [Lactuca sativa]|uniref:ENTH domain-containing protein n=1 Tax=Lactuca sativa TaxID=4236 RepID=A0A9R1XAV0_LACSA|nr:clathrin interactor EPSIN 2 isoform X2 [Lactuca sativa]KAJ0201782.1 hypothetical protein LSAT_V11C600319710 [Lactuca sativa]